MLINQEKEKVARAKKASKSISGAPGSNTEPSQPTDLRTMLEAAWDEHVA